MPNLFTKNTVEDHFKKISITGRFAFGVTCLEHYIKEQTLESKWLDRIINVLWEFTTSKDVTDWNKRISELDPNNILDKNPNNKASHYDSLTELEFNELKKYYRGLPKDLLLLIDLVIDIGTSNLYGATGDYSKSTLESTMMVYKFSQEKIDAMIDINKFKVSKFSEQNGWGNAIEKTAFQ